jgi:hypothetical protein
MVAGALSRLEGVNIGFGFRLALLGRAHADIEELRLILKRVTHEPKYASVVFTFKD